jgi:P-type conjugative transfer protein TrbJ
MTHCLALVLCLILVTPHVAAAQVVVEDPASIGQLIVQIKKQIEQYYEQLKQTQQLAAQTWQGGQNLLKFDVNNVQDLLNLYRTLDTQLGSAQRIGYQAGRAWQDAQAIYPRIQGVPSAAQQAALERDWAAAQRDSARVAVVTEAIQGSQQRVQQEWTDLLNRGAATQGNLQIQQANLQGLGLVGHQLATVEQLLATQAREDSQRSLREASQREMETSAREASSPGLDTGYAPQGKALGLTTGKE